MYLFDFIYQQEVTCSLFDLISAHKLSYFIRIYCPTIDQIPNKLD